jgi:transcription factor IIIB 90 kDa subunit
MEEPLVSLARFFSSVCTLLQLKLTLFEPAQHLPSLESHLTMLIHAPKESSLPNTLVTTLTPLLPRLPAVRNTVMSLATLVARVDGLANMPTAPSACALFILALEGELSASLPNAGALAQALGVRLSVSKAVVMQRYKMIYDLVEEYIKEVPWLDAYEQKAIGKSRSKVAKRVIVAKGLKDVVQFQDDIWRRKFVTSENPILVLETETDDDDETSTEGSVYSFGTSGSAASGSTDHTQTFKRRKTRHERHVTEASRFLLQPHFTVSASTSSEAGRDLVHHLLTTDDTAFACAFSRPPTRLQLLTNVRGGEAAIADDELFDDGELDSFLRTSEEVDALRRTVDWDEGPDTDLKPPKKRKRPASDTGEGTNADTPRIQRINMDVLARLLDPSTIMGEDDLDFVMPEDLEEEGSMVDDIDLPALGLLADDEEILEEWRPMSPGGAGYDDERYDL